MENNTTNTPQTVPPLRATARRINLQVPEQVHLLCKLLGVELSGVLQRFINDQGHDLYGTNGSSERWQAIEYFMECGYGLHNYGSMISIKCFMSWSSCVTVGQAVIRQRSRNTPLIVCVTWCNGIGHGWKKGARAR